MSQIFEPKEVGAELDPRCCLQIPALPPITLAPASAFFPAHLMGSSTVRKTTPAETSAISAGNEATAWRAFTFSTLSEQITLLFRIGVTMHLRGCQILELGSTPVTGLGLIESLC